MGVGAKGSDGKVSHHGLEPCGVGTKDGSISPSEGGHPQGLIEQIVVNFDRRALGDLPLHDAVKLFFLLMRIGPSFVEVGHEIGPIVHVGGCWCARHQLVKLLISPLGGITNH